MTENSKLQVGLLLCDDVDESARSSYGTYTEMFIKGISATDSDLVLNPIQCYQGEVPESPDDFDAFLISGSRYSAYDPFPWIAQLQNFVQQCWDSRKKTVGICFGHQLIAQALGGEARKADVGWGIGIHTARLTQPQVWMENDDLQTRESYNLVVIHQDQVFKLPPGFETIAENDFCPVSMYVGGNVMLGIQAHPEFDKEFCEYRINYRKEVLGPELYEQSLDSLDQMELDSGQVLGWISQFIRS